MNVHERIFFKGETSEKSEAWRSEFGKEKWGGQAEVIDWRCAKVRPCLAGKSNLKSRVVNKLIDCFGSFVLVSGQADREPWFSWQLTDVFLDGWGRILMWWGLLSDVCCCFCCYCDVLQDGVCAVTWRRISLCIRHALRYWDSFVLWLVLLQLRCPSGDFSIVLAVRLSLIFLLFPEIIKKNAIVKVNNPL